MANTLTPFGFQHVGYMEGYRRSYGFRRRKIALGNTVRERRAKRHEVRTRPATDP
jgi:hypothetical protein